MKTGRAANVKGKMVNLKFKMPGLPKRKVLSGCGQYIFSCNSTLLPAAALFR
jgi:hypothetical protein